MLTLLKFCKLVCFQRIRMHQPIHIQHHFIITQDSEVPCTYQASSWSVWTQEVKDSLHRAVPEWHLRSWSLFLLLLHSQWSHLKILQSTIILIPSPKLYRKYKATLPSAKGRERQHRKLYRTNVLPYLFLQQILRRKKAERKCLLIKKIKKNIDQISFFWN